MCGTCLEERHRVEQIKRPLPSLLSDTLALFTYEKRIIKLPTTNDCQRRLLWEEVFMSLSSNHG